MINAHKDGRPADDVKLCCLRKRRLMFVRYWGGNVLDMVLILKVMFELELLCIRLEAEKDFQH